MNEIRTGLVMKNREPTPRDIYWCTKLHLDTVTIDLSRISNKEQHKSYSVEGKERPVILLKFTANRFGKREFIGAYTTTKNLDGRGKERDDVIDCPDSKENGPSYIELPTQKISEQLLTRFKYRLHEQAFREIKRRITVFQMQQLRD